MSRVGSKKFGGLIDELLVFQTEVRIVFQKNKLKVKPERRGFSRHGRLLAYVVVGGENFNIEIVRQGLLIVSK
jgi:hypothetical protein